LSVCLQAHAEDLQAQTQMVLSQPVMVQAAVKAQSLQAQAQSLEAQAEAQNMQVRMCHWLSAAAAVCRARASAQPLLPVLGAQYREDRVG
jgi:hypothetical protein